MRRRIALGDIRTPEAAKVLAQAKPADEVKSAVTDASLACAESLLSAGKNGDALAIYKGLVASDPPKHVKLAATRGMLACRHQVVGRPPINEVALTLGVSKAIAMSPRYIGSGSCGL